MNSPARRRRRRNPWPRRIISTTIVLLLLIAIIAGTVTLIYRAVSPDSRRAGQAHTAAQPGASHVAQSGEGAPESGDGSQSGAGTTGGIPLCDAGSFQGSTELGVSPVLIGQGTSIDVTLTNKTPQPCFTTVSHLRLNIDSGGYTVFDSTSCESQSGDMPLLFGPHQSWTGHMTWDGRIYDSSCSPIDNDSDGQADIADVGGYSARITFDGHPVTKTPLTFEVRYE